MNLQPVEDTHGQLVQCIFCKHWSNLSDSFADLEGEPFKAYYCANCAKKLRSKK